MHPSPARGEIIQPGVSTPGERFDQPNASEPRKGRHHKARRANAGGSDSTNPMHPSPARGDIIKPGVSTPGGAIRPTQCIRAPQGARSYSPACQRLGSDSTNPMHPSPARGEIIQPGVSTPGERFDQPNPSEPRKRRHHKARRVNAGTQRVNAGTRSDQPNASEPRKGRHHKARRANAGGAIRPTQCIRAPQGATS